MARTTFILIPLSAAVLLASVACTLGPGQEVPIQLSEFKVDSSVTAFTAGTKYRFVVANTGGVEHEWMVMPRGEQDHAKALAAIDKQRLQPGASAARQLNFNNKGNFEFACHLPGHYEAGMVLLFTVN